MAISGDLPILLVRVVEDDDLPLVRQVLQAQEYWRLKGLQADVVILNEHPSATATRCRSSSRRCRQRAVGGVEGPSGRCVPDEGRRLPAGARAVGAVARAVLIGDAAICPGNSIGSRRRRRLRLH